MVAGSIAIFVVTLALEGGGYGAETRALGTLLVWSVLIGGLVVLGWPAARLPGAALASGTALTGLAALAAASLGWAGDAGHAFGEVLRVWGYLGLFALVAVSTGRGGARAWLIGLAAGGLGIAALGLGHRLVPSLFAGDELLAFLPDTRGRLSQPIGYWNGLAASLALTTVLLAGLGAAAESRQGRATATALMPIPVLALFFTASRGGAAAAVAGTVVLLAVGPARRRLLATLVVGGTAAGLLIALAAARDELVDGLAGGAARAQGRELLVLTVVAVVATGTLRFWLDPRAERIEPSRVVARALALAGVLAAAGALAVADLPRRVRDFQEPPAQVSGSPAPGFAARHLTSAEGGGRYQLWQSAWKAFRERPVVGLGAGGFEAWWAERGSLSLPAKDAHSLFLETLAELGLLGALCLAGFFGAAAAAGTRRRGDPDAPTAVAVLACGAVSAAVDWTWELPVVFAPVVVAAALVTGPATAGRGKEPRLPAGRYLLGLPLLLLGLAAIVAASIALASERSLRESRTAAAHGDLPRAAREAGDARSVQPWAAAPRLQLALVAERRGRLEEARASIVSAIARSPDDWRLWLVRARLETKLGQAAQAAGALARARQLNPRARIFARNLRGP